MICMGSSGCCSGNIMIRFQSMPTHWLPTMMPPRISYRKCLCASGKSIRPSFNRLRCARTSTGPSEIPVSIIWALKKKRPVSSLSDTELGEEDSIAWSVEEEPDEDDIPNYREMLQKGIEQLPEKCKEVFLLSRSGNLSNQEIADNLGISIKTVNNQTWKAMKLLKAFVSKSKSWLWPVVSWFFTRL